MQLRFYVSRWFEDSNAVSVNQNPNLKTLKINLQNSIKLSNNLKSHEENCEKFHQRNRNTLSSKTKAPHPPHWAQFNLFLSISFLSSTQ